MVNGEFYHIAITYNNAYSLPSCLCQRPRDDTYPILVRTRLTIEKKTPIKVNQPFLNHTCQPSLSITITQCCLLPMLVIISNH